MDSLSGDLSIVPALVSEIVRSISYCRNHGTSMPMLYAQLFQLWFCNHLHYFYELQTPSYLERSTIMNSKGIDLPFEGSSEEWALYLIGFPRSKWAWKVTWGPAQWHAWTHCHRLVRLPLPRVWGCIGYYPSLALR